MTEPPPRGYGDQCYERDGPLPGQRMGDAPTPIVEAWAEAGVPGAAAELERRRESLERPRGRSEAPGG